MCASGKHLTLSLNILIRWRAGSMKRNAFGGDLTIQKSRRFKRHLMGSIQLDRVNSRRITTLTALPVQLYIQGFRIDNPKSWSVTWRLWRLGGTRTVRLWGTT